MRKPIACWVAGMGILWLGNLSGNGLAAVPTPVPRGGLVINYALVVIDNLQVGQSVSMEKLTHMPLTIENDWNAPVYVTIETSQPTADRLEEGYAAVPNASWVIPEANGLTIPALGMARVDLAISVPNKDSLMGKKYQVNLDVKTEGDRKTFFNYGAFTTGKLCFSVSKVRDPKAVERAMQGGMDTNFDFTEPLITLWNVKSGQKVRIVTPDGKDPLLKNDTQVKQELRLAAVAPKDAPMVKTDPRAQTDTDPNDVRLGAEEVVLAPGKSQTIKIEIQVPAQADLTKGPLNYLVFLRSDAHNVSKYLRILLWGGAEPTPIALKHDTITIKK